MNQTDVTWYKEKFFFLPCTILPGYLLWLNLHIVAAARCMPACKWVNDGDTAVVQWWRSTDVIQNVLAKSIRWKNMWQKQFFWMWKHPQHPHVHVRMVKKNEHLISLCIHTIKSLIRYEVIRVSVLFATGYQKLQLRWLRFVFSCKAANNLEYENATESKK